MSADAFIACMFVGAALLAGWVLVRFEQVGPRSLIGRGLRLGRLRRADLRDPVARPGRARLGSARGRLVVIFGVALPIFTYFFLAGAWFMRSVMELLNGAPLSHRRARAGTRERSRVTLRGSTLFIFTFAVGTATVAAIALSPLYARRLQVRQLVTARCRARRNLDRCSAPSPSPRRAAWWRRKTSSSCASSRCCSSERC